VLPDSETIKIRVVEMTKRIVAKDNLMGSRDKNQQGLKDVHLNFLKNTGY
jgi:hypothetical protein